MKARKDDRGQPLEVKALYSVQELACAGGVTRFSLLRLLRANGVQLVTGGRAVMVPLTEIETRIPPLWRSLVAAERLRAEARRAE